MLLLCQVVMEFDILLHSQVFGTLSWEIKCLNITRSLNVITKFLTQYILILSFSL